MPEHDDAIGHELQKVAAVVLSLPADLLRDDPGQSRLRQPVADAKEFSTLDSLVSEEAEQHVDSVENDARGMKLFGLALKEMEHADQVEFPGFHDVRREARIQEEKLLLCGRGTCPSERGGVGENLARTLFKGHENARLLGSTCAIDERLKRKDGLSTARSTHHQGRVSTRQSTIGDLVE